MSRIITENSVPLFRFCLRPLPRDPAPSPPAAETDVSARSKALELAGAFSNDGYKIRDGYWPGEIEPDRAQFLEVNLFAGNEYWFSAAVTSPGRKIAVGVLNEKGKPWTIKSMRTGRLPRRDSFPR